MHALADGDLLIRLEEAEARMDTWIAEGKSLELCGKLADLAVLAGLAREYRAAISAGDPALLEVLALRARAALLVKSDADRCGTLLLFHAKNNLTGRLKQMYGGFAEGMHCSAAPVQFDDGLEGLCVRAGDVPFAVHQHLKNETGVHSSGSEQCAVSALPLPSEVSSDGYVLEAFYHPDDHRIHRTKSCVRVSREGLACESISLRSAVQNRDLALSALAARLEDSGQTIGLIRDYDFSDGTVTDRRLDKCFSTGDLLPLFETLLLAE